jgi:tetratricopeptide (TPR) repeat protein
MRVSPALWLLAAVPFFAFPASARAEEPAPTEPPKEEKPAEAEKKPEKPKTDDTDIFKDFNLSKPRGIGHHKERAKFWAEKGVTGKSLYWLARFWQKGEDYPNAVETFEKYFAWDPATDPAVDPKVKEKWVSDKEKNTEAGRKELMEIFLRMKEWKKAIEAAQRYRKDYPNGGAVKDSFVQEGRGHRMDGNVDAAIAAFTSAADAGFAKGFLDLVELLLAEGRYPEAKKAADAAMAGELAKNSVVKGMSAFAAVAGESGPALDKLVSVGRDTPALAGKPVLFYFWHLQIAIVDRKLAALERDVQRPLGDKIAVVGLGTFNRLNPETQKVEEEMTPEAETEWYKKFATNWDIRSAFVAPKDVLEALQLRYEGQMVAIDGEGKLRWMRIGKDEPYDRLAAEAAMRRLAEPPAK